MSYGIVTCDVMLCDVNGGGVMYGDTMDCDVMGVDIIMYGDEMGDGMCCDVIGAWCIVM